MRKAYYTKDRKTYFYKLKQMHALCWAYAGFLIIASFCMTLVLLFIWTDPLMGVSSLGLADLPMIEMGVGGGGLVEFSLTPLFNDGLAAAPNTAVVSTNVFTGYNLKLSTNSTTENALLPKDDGSAARIGAVDGTSSAPKKLGVNEWGYAVAGESGFGAAGTYAKPDSDSKWAGMPKKGSAEANVAVKTTNRAAANDQTTIYYGVKAGMNLPPDDYTQTVIYTVTANIVGVIPAPTIASVEPAQGVAGERITVSGTHFIMDGQSIVTAVFVDLDGDGQADANEVCANPAIAGGTGAGLDTIECNAPNDGAAGNIYNVIVTTWGGTSYDVLNPTTADDFFYRFPVCRSGNEAHNLCQIDIDSNMIPVKYAGDTSAPRWVKAGVTEADGGWYDYEEKKWANAVSVEAGKLGDYQAAAEGTVVDDNDILGYFVYIPRYAYRVQRLAAWHKPRHTQNPFEIVFENVGVPKKTPYMGVNTSAGSDATGRCTTPPVSALSSGAAVGGVDYQTDCGVSADYPIAAPYDRSQWATHPAFTIGGAEVNGWWVGKYESGSDTYCINGGGTSPVAGQCGENVAPDHVYIKPNKSPMTYRQIGAMNKMAINLSSNPKGLNSGNAVTGNTGTNLMNLSADTQTMQMKNDQWGAAAYLATSVYGVGDTACKNIFCTENKDKKVYNNAYFNGGAGGNVTDSASSPLSPSKSFRYQTGCGPVGSYVEGYTSVNCSAYHTEVGQQASTTGNVYGVYDLAGGAWEYVMGNYNDTQNVGHMAVMPAEEYVNVYRTTDVPSFGVKPVWSVSSNNVYYLFDACSFATCGGQANYETNAYQSVNYDYHAWNADFSVFVDGSYPWVIRSGAADNNEGCGLFGSYRYGSPDDATTWRAVAGIY
jgi:hypothetical protein